MEINQAGLPRRLQFWRGAILSTVAHAIWIASDPSLSHELSWDGCNYSRQDSMGARGTITFAGDLVIGVFRDDTSPRAPWRSNGDYSLARFFIGIPKDLLAIAEEEALQYLIDEYNGEKVPIITTAFWSDEDYLKAAEPWSDVLANGAHVVRIELMETESAIAEWQKECEFSDLQTSLMKSLFTRKISTPDTPVTLLDQEYDILIMNGTDGIEESCDALTAIGISIPQLH